MKLEYVLLNLEKFDKEGTIYALEPWGRTSKSLVAPEPNDGTLPPEASENGMKYFLEIDIALEHLEGWIGNLGYVPSAEEICERLICYARNDA